MKVKEILKTTGIIRTTADETLAAVLANLPSSHSAAFVFDSEDYKNYLGVVSPYYTMIRTTYPPETKVETVLFHCPKLSLTDDLTEAVRLMNESKIHYLPVFDAKRAFVGIATARRIMRKLLDENLLNISVADVLAKKKQLITINENQQVSEALSVFKTNKVSKLVCVDDHSHLRGVLTYYDLIALSLSPKFRISYGDRAGNRHKDWQMPVKNFMKTYVLTLKPTDTLSLAASMILDKEIGSVVVLDNNKKPIGIITTKDIISVILENEVNSYSDIDIKNIKGKELVSIELFLKRLFRKTQKKDFAVKFFAEKDGKVFKLRLDIKIKDQSYHFDREGKNLSELIAKLDKAIEEVV
ncbi:MAG: CBS domain-containing protein [Patescibacteria group bacterium]|nr:MAG: CBS domain-containing protein [Patescibacteria group bacterium]